ncbi:hypothetical protein [Dongia sp.]|uniref:YcgJ family protein n=1 Tax=Dongia sp. TaxID=1977262 RepID=UPI0035B293BC
MLAWFSSIATGTVTRTVASAVLASGLIACSETPQPVKVAYVSSTYGVDNAPAAYGTPSPYGYATPWGLPPAETIGYLWPATFSPRQGLICERTRHVCYDRNGVDYAETDKYLGDRAHWNRLRLYGGSQVYPPAQQ